MEQKKLDLTEARKKILQKALTLAGKHMDKQTPGSSAIYLGTVSQIKRAGDRILLTNAQWSIIMNALARYTPMDSEQAEIDDMAAQLTLTRKRYAQYMAAKA